MNKVMAALAILVGGLDAVLQLGVAFGVHVTPDQHTAIGSVAGLALLVLGVWFHPSVPIGKTGGQ